MKQRSWLIAIVAAVFVLQAPLCVFACIPGSTSNAEMADGQPSPSCHEPAPSSSETPDDPAESHDDCSCDASYRAILASPEQSYSNVQTVVALPPRVLDTRRVGHVTRASIVWPSETDLPPPDILLLKSTLLI